MKTAILGLSIVFLTASSAWGKEVKVFVNGMVCAFCAQGITKKMRAEPAVKKVEVSLEQKTVTLELKDGKDIADDKIKDILVDAGYTVEKIERN